MISATQPWSGNYLASPTIWASAHTTQFTRPGKSRHLTQGRGAGELVGGGTYVSFFDPEQRDLTIVIESAGQAVGSFCDHNCNGVCNYKPATSAQNATFVLSNLKLGGSKLVLWRSQLGGGVTEAHLFEQLADVPIVDGKLAILVETDAIYTLSTIRTASKAGGSPPTIPPSAPFPLPYSDDFETTAPPRAARYWSDMDGGFEIAPSAAAAAPPGAKNHHRSNHRRQGKGNQVLKQTVTKKPCCNFIAKLDGPMPLSIIGSSAWENVKAAISIFVPAGWALFGLRAKFAAGSFFAGGLGTPSGLFLALDQHGYQLVTSPAAVAGGLKWPCPPPCLASGTFSTNSSWREVMLSTTDRTAHYSVDGASVRHVSLPPTVATGAGFAAIASSYTEVEFDNFNIEPSSSGLASRCLAAPAAGHKLVVVGCGEPAADKGAKWHIDTGDNGTGPISLRSDSSLCLVPGVDVRVVAETGHNKRASAAAADANTTAAEEREEATSATATSALPTNATWPSAANALVWNTSTHGHGVTIVYSNDSHCATWRTSPGKPGCDAVALAAVPMAGDNTSSFWVSLEAPKPKAGDVTAASGGLGGDGQTNEIVVGGGSAGQFVDIGWCTPNIDVSGKTWMGWQKGKAWVYRGDNGYFKYADGKQDQGSAYGLAFGVGSNITATRHSPTSLEFFIDGKSNGKITLAAAQALPVDAVPCAGACASSSMGLTSGSAPPSPFPPTPPPPPPPTPIVSVVLAKCVAGDPLQQWRYDAVGARISHDSGGSLVMTSVPGASVGDFAEVTLDPKAASSLWWSADEAMGYIHSSSNRPMTCNCLAVCGGC
jgi:hypothetical protein